MKVNSTGTHHRARLTALGVVLAVLSPPAILLAQPSNTNHGSPTGISNASATGRENSNVNGIGTASAPGTAPVPETSTYVAMATLLAAAAFARHRRRRVAE